MNFFDSVIRADTFRSAVVDTNVRCPATTATTDYDDTFHELRVELEQGAQDLEWRLSHLPIDEMLKRPQPNQLFHDALFISSKLNKVNTSEFLLDIIPHCLHVSSSMFQTGFVYQLNSFAAPINPFQLEQLVIVHYKMSINQLHQQLGSIYLQSGTGQLEMAHPCRRQFAGTQLHYWPAYWPALTVARAYSTMFYRDHMDHEQHIDSVKRYLSHLEEQRHGFLLQYDAIKQGMKHYTPDLVHQLENFVRQHALSSVNIYFETMFNLLKHDYMDRFMQLQYVQEKSTQEQMNKANKICQLTLHRTRAEHESILHGESIYGKQWTKLCTLFLAKPPMILTRLQDAQARANVLTQYTQVIDRAKTDMNQVLTMVAAQCKDYAQRELNTYLTEHWNEEHRLDTRQRLTKTMRQLIEQRQQNITDCVRFVYEQNGGFLLDTSTMMTRELLRMM